jgi:uncharacterized protein YpmS
MSENNNGPDKTTSPGKPKRSLGKTIKRLTLLALLAVAVTAGVIFYLARSEPAYWKEHQQFLRESTPQQIERLAEQVDTQLTALANLGLDEAASQAETATQTLDSLAVDESKPTKTKPEDVRINTDKTITLSNDQLAAIVQTRMDEWMNDRGYIKPPEITDPLITVDGGDLVMAFAFEVGGFSSVISGKFGLKIRDDGKATLAMKRFLVGRLPVPADAIGEHLRQKSGGDERAAKVGEWLEKLQELEFKPVIELEHRRRARVQSYVLHDHGLEITVRVQDHKTYKSMNKALAGVPVD